MNKKDDTQTVRVSQKTYALLAKHKEKNGVSFLFTMEKAVTEYFERLEKKEK